jgi:hypothetical protein
MCTPASCWPSFSISLTAITSLAPGAHVHIAFEVAPGGLVLLGPSQGTHWLFSLLYVPSGHCWHLGPPKPARCGYTTFDDLPAVRQLSYLQVWYGLLSGPKCLQLHGPVADSFSANSQLQAATAHAQSGVLATLLQII